MLAVSNLSKVYGDRARGTRAIDRLDFSVAEREFCTVVGPSGCGKTTLIKCIAGLLAPTTGATTVHGVTVQQPPPEMAVIFQDYNRSLLPWLTVERNVTLPLRHRIDSRQRLERARDALGAVGLSDFGSYYPWQLSGGMQQRVAIARALAYRPRVLLMDEPFASVDAQTRAELEDLVLQVRDELEVTVLLVSHDVDESVYMSDRVVVLTAPPSRVQAVVSVELPRPRHQLETKALPSFIALRTRVFESIAQGRAANASSSAKEE